MHNAKANEPRLGDKADSRQGLEPAREGYIHLQQISGVVGTMGWGQSRAWTDKEYSGPDGTVRVGVHV